MPKPPVTRVTTERVVAAATAIVDGDGIDALSLTRVAADLGVSQPALYNHVDGLQDLLRRLSLVAREQLVDALRRAAVGTTRDQAVRAVAEAWRTFVLTHPGLYAATDRYPVGTDPEIKAAVADVVGVLEAVLQGYDIAPRQRSAAAWSLRSAFHGFCALEVEGGHPLPQDLDAGYTHLLALLCAGLQQLESAPGRGRGRRQR